MAGKGKSDAHRRIEASRGHGHPELHLDYAYMGREAEVRASPFLVGKVSKDRWLITPCAVQRDSASVDRWKACKRRDHVRCANHGGEVQSGGVDRR